MPIVSSYSKGPLIILFEGSSINDVTVIGRERRRGFFDNCISNKRLESGGR